MLVARKVPQPWSHSDDQNLPPKTITGAKWPRHIALPWERSSWVHHVGLSGARALKGLFSSFRFVEYKHSEGSSVKPKTVWSVPVVCNSRDIDISLSRNVGYRPVTHAAHQEDVRQHSVAPSRSLNIPRTEEKAVT